VGGWSAGQIGAPGMGVSGWFEQAGGQGPCTERPGGAEWGITRHATWDWPAAFLRFAGRSRSTTAVECSEWGATVCTLDRGAQATLTRRYWGGWWSDTAHIVLGEGCRGSAGSRPQVGPPRSVSGGTSGPSSRIKALVRGGRGRSGFPACRGAPCNGPVDVTPTASTRATRIATRVPAPVRRPLPA